MEFLKAILGEELYAQVAEKVNAYNGDAANKDKQIKIGNLGGGEYVGKGKYEALQALLDGKTTELDTANTLIADLKKSNKGNEDLQGKVTAYETQVAELQKELEKTKLESAIKVELLAAKALDVDYLTFKLKEKEELALDDDGKIKGWDDKLSALKTWFPTQFESAGGREYKEYRLPTGEPGPMTVTEEQFRKMGYNERLKLKQENEQLYRQYTKN